MPPGAQASAKSSCRGRIRSNVEEDLTEELRRELTIHFVQGVDEVLLLALLPGLQTSGVNKTVRRVQPGVQ